MRAGLSTRTAPDGGIERRRLRDGAPDSGVGCAPSTVMTVPSTSSVTIAF